MASKTAADGRLEHQSGYLKSTETPPIFRIPFIHSRYRQNGKPWHFYVRSLFGLHNETGNVWTHLLGSLLLANELWNFRRDFADSAPFDTAMVTLFGTFSVVVHLVSSGAHLLHSHSPRTHLLVCSCDYACVGIEGFVYNIVGYCFYSHESYYNAMRTFIVPVSMTLSFTLSASMAFILASRKRNISGKIFRMMLIPAIAYFVIGLGPVWHKILLLMWSRKLTMFQGHHLLHPIALGLGFTFFITRFPERWFPGRFDLVGHSHQWFHIGVTLSEFFVIRGVRTDLLTKPSVLCSQREQLFSIGQLWLSKSLLVVINLIYIALLYRRYHKKSE